MFDWRIPGFLGLLSCFGSFCVILSYTSFAALRKHPSLMVLFLSMCDFMYSIKFVLECNNLLPNSWCVASALWAQFWGMASISWNAMLSLNVIINLHDPFKCTSTYLKFYHIFVWSVASGTTLVLYFNEENLGRMEGEYICGVKQQDDPLHLLFYIPLLSYFFLGFCCLGLSIRRISTLKNPELFQTSQRRALMSRVILVVFVFTLCWSIPTVTRGMNIFVKSIGTESLQLFLFLDLCSLGFQGFMNALVWLTNPSFTMVVEEKWEATRYKIRTAWGKHHERGRLLDEPPYASRSPIHSLDVMLRTDVLSCLLLGIQDSALGETKDCSKFISSKEFPELFVNGQSAPSQKKTGFYFFDFHPTSFAKVRAHDGISNERYLGSLNMEKFINDGKFKVSDARSGAFFCIPPDKQFIIKMITLPEAQFLDSIIPALSSHYLTEENTLIVKFYGFHGVLLPQGYVVYMVVMANVFNTTAKLDENYDLKGSWVGRKSNRTQLGLDLDLKRKVNLSDETKMLFLGQISKDATFLCGLGILDYSLIIGFHFVPTSGSLQLNELNIPNLWSHGVLSADGKEQYFMGIIDFLQQYNFRKKIEFFFKTKLLCKDSKGLSAIPPLQYSTRFLRAMQNMLQHNIDADIDDGGFTMI